MIIHHNGPLTFALVQVPEDAKDVYIIDDSLVWFDRDFKTDFIDLQDENWKLIGKVSKLSDPEIQQMVTDHGLKAETTYVLKLKEK